MIPRLCSAARNQLLSKSPVANQLAGWRQRRQHQPRALVVAHLSFTEQQHDGPALSVADDVQFGIQPAFGAPDAARCSPF